MVFRLNLGHIWETSGTLVTSVIFQFNFGHSKCILKKKIKAGVVPLRWIAINLLIHWFIGSCILLLEICQAKEVFQDMIV